MFYPKSNQSQVLTSTKSKYASKEKKRRFQCWSRQYEFTTTEEKETNQF